MCIFFFFLFFFCILGKQRPVDDGGGSRRSRWEKPKTEPATATSPPCDVAHKCGPDQTAFEGK
ncbi:Uncharacterized protein APZ42_019135 [Daphnia magna]|uniref:Secreted protein n=1 Tax=Daphnia magna TaxID=35525 RepID=A0A164YJT6_9CRUS|nr:Uncharacterized protein APZ42_019135 [Daphnia magna]